MFIFKRQLIFIKNKVVRIKIIYYNVKGEMMKFLLVLLSIIIGIFLFFSVLFLIVYKKIKKFGNGLGYNNLDEIKDLIKQGECESRYNHKNALGMTNLLLPRIVKDFPNFSESELYNKVEISLLAIFESLENKKVSNNNELDLIKDNLDKIINDYKQNKINVRYDDVVFHKHAIKYYKKDPGVLSITVSTALEYFYEKQIGDKIIVKRNDYKRQTSYTTEYIYIYDPDKYTKHTNLIGIHCPNCGAPVKHLSEKICIYCNSGLEDINLKSWHISSYKEDYD